MQFAWLFLTTGLLSGAPAEIAPPDPPVTAPALSSAYRPYQIRLSTLAEPPTGAIGLIIKAKVNNGPALRLLLDSGAEHLVLDRKAARRSGQSSGVSLDLIGAGLVPRHARIATAASLQIGELQFRDAPIVIVEGEIMEGVDGVMPLAMFSGFLVHLNVPAKRLDLEPFPESELPCEPGFVPVKTHHNLLFLRTKLDGRHNGTLLLDTGSFYNVISTTAAKALNRMTQFGGQVSILAGTGDAQGQRISGRVSYKLGDRDMTMEPVVAVNLEQMSQRNRIDVSGVIGFPALTGSVITVDYRQSAIRIVTK